MEERLLLRLLLRVKRLEERVAELERELNAVEAVLLSGEMGEPRGGRFEVFGKPEDTG